MTTTNTNTHYVCWQKTTKTRNSHCRDRVHYAVSDTTPRAKGHLNKGIFASYVCRWSIAAGKRPVPFRTRKLSPPAPMVLPPGGSGRVGYRRPNNFTHSTRHTTVCAAGAFFWCCMFAGLSALRTTPPPPTIGVHPRIVRINTTPSPTQNRPGETQHRRRFVHNRCPA